MKRSLPRRLHPGAWWLWALGLLVGATQTTNPLLLSGIVVACGLVVAARRPAAGWATGYRAYLLVAGLVVAIRVTFRILLGGEFGDHTVFALPSVELPGISGSMGGAVTLEEVLAGLYDGLQLGTIIVCVGAANTLADPRRLVGALPRAAGAMATSVVVALSLAPQLVESLGRVRRARRLRGESGGGWRAVRSLLVPVLEDTLHRSLALAASMDSRGYGRSHHPETRGRTRLLAWTGLAAMCLGIFTLLSSSEVSLAVVLLVGGIGTSMAGLRRLGRSLTRTRYRPEPWAGAEWVVALAGLAAGAGITLSGALDPGALHPSLQPLTWPPLSPVWPAALAVALLPSLAAPPVPLPSGAIPEGAHP